MKEDVARFVGFVESSMNNIRKKTDTLLGQSDASLEFMMRRTLEDRKEMYDGVQEC
ncbi:hypothetical protein PHJA_001162700 [Phtheirospermum japonicum]|uniref:Uncharacterized protein n=1 Tax=Phtheirospermum japonicum TaxID=374723 RepID=A0A830BYU0_9LAMI|nr:hypothetical protein PHJA_001162700 [Phtheirospermum japonicum]